MLDDGVEIYRYVPLPRRGSVLDNMRKIPPATIHVERGIEGIKAGVWSPQELVEFIMTNPSVGFFYMMPAVKTASIDYSPYYMKWVSLSKFISSFDTHFYHFNENLVKTSTFAEVLVFAEYFGISSEV